MLCLCIRFTAALATGSSILPIPADIFFDFFRYIIFCDFGLCLRSEAKEGRGFWIGFAVFISGFLLILSPFAMANVYQCRCPLFSILPTATADCSCRSYAWIFRKPSSISSQSFQHCKIFLQAGFSRYFANSSSLVLQGCDPETFLTDM